MKTKLLKDLRSSAKHNVYLVPADGDTNNCLIAKLIWNAQLCGYDIRYYYRKISGSCDVDKHLVKTGVKYHGKEIRKADSKFIQYEIDFRDNRKPLTLRWSLIHDEKGKPVMHQGGWPLQEAIEVLKMKRREFILEQGREKMENYYKRKEFWMTKKLSKY